MSKRTWIALAIAGVLLVAGVAVTAVVLSGRQPAASPAATTVDERQEQPESSFDTRLAAKVFDEFGKGLAEGMTPEQLAKLAQEADSLKEGAGTPDGAPELFATIASLCRLWGGSAQAGVRELYDVRRNNTEGTYTVPGGEQGGLKLDAFRLYALGRVFEHRNQFDRAAEFYQRVARSFSGATIAVGPDKYSYGPAVVMARLCLVDLYQSKLKMPALANTQLAELLTQSPDAQIEIAGSLKTVTQICEERVALRGATPTGETSPVPAAATSEAKPALMALAAGQYAAGGQMQQAVDTLIQLEKSYARLVTKDNAGKEHWLAFEALSAMQKAPSKEEETLALVDRLLTRCTPELAWYVMIWQARLLAAKPEGRDRAKSILHTVVTGFNASSMDELLRVAGVNPVNEAQRYLETLN